MNAAHRAERAVAHIDRLLVAVGVRSRTGSVIGPAGRRAELAIQRVDTLIAAARVASAASSASRTPAERTRTRWRTAEGVEYFERTGRVVGIR